MSAITYNDNEYLPVLNSTTSYWRSVPHTLDSHRSTTDLPRTCDVCIIGSGMSGAAVAYHLLENSSTSSSSSSSREASSQAAPSEKETETGILVLEARQLCSGATGRNGGHSKILASSIVNLISLHGEALANELVALILRNIRSIKRMAEKMGVSEYAQVELRRSFDIFMNEADATKIVETLAAVDDRSVTDTLDHIASENLEYVTSVKEVKGAFSSSALSLWPYRFVCALFESMLSRHTPDQLNVQTHTPVLSVSQTPRDGGGGTDCNNNEMTNVISTPRGLIYARRVVFACNAYTAGLIPAYKGVIVPYKGTACHISPSTSSYLSSPFPSSSSSSLPPRLANTYNMYFELNGASRRMDYMNPRPDGGIVLGGAKWTYESKREVWWNTVDDSSLLGDAAKEHFEGYMQRHFHGWDKSGDRVDAIWTGIMGQTPDSLPHVGRVPTSSVTGEGNATQFMLGGFNGDGMPIIMETARALADLISGRVDDLKDAGIPEQFKTTLERLNKTQKLDLN